MKHSIFILLLSSITVIACAKGKTMNSQLAFIMLNEQSVFNEQKLKDQLIDDWGISFGISNYSEKEKDVTFELDGITIAVAEMPLPIPPGDLEFPIKTAWYWENAESDIKNHKYHLVVFCNGDISKKEAANIITKVATSLLKVENGVGVYWGSSSQVIQKELFCGYADMVKTDTNPIPIWIKTTGYKNEDDSFYLYTIGLKDFSLRELEIEKYKGQWGDGLTFLMEISNYLIENGPIIKDGNTVGSTADEKIVAQYKKSSLKNDEDVISFIW